MNKLAKKEVIEDFLYLIVIILIIAALTSVNIGTVVLLGWPHLLYTGGGTLLLLAGFILTIVWEDDSN